MLIIVLYFHELSQQEFFHEVIYLFVLLMVYIACYHWLQNLVNGYVLKGKPMIIQFGRNPAAAKAT